MDTTQQTLLPLADGTGRHVIERGAKFSDCRRYRYLLWRRWSQRPALAVIGLNPSTADEAEDDPTIRRCMAFADRLGCGALRMVNLFAYRSTDPKGLLEADDPIGPGCDGEIVCASIFAQYTIAAWGATAFNGAHRLALESQDRVTDIRTTLLPDDLPVYCFGQTRDGHPRHPLYLHRDTPLERYDWPVFPKAGDR